MCRLIPLLLVITALIQGCSGDKSAGELALELQKEYTQANELRMKAEIRADYGERVWIYLLEYADGTVTILEPESVAGVTAKVGEDGVTLSFDGAEVFTGALTEGGLSPAEALPEMLRLWREGLVISAGIYGDVLELRHRAGDGLVLVSRFETDTLYPVSAELIRDGFTVIYADFKDITF